MSVRQSKNLSVSPQKIKRRARNRLNKTERAILTFLLTQTVAKEDYHTYSSDPKLLKFIKKSQPQTHRALRSLFNRGLLAATPDHHVRGCPRIYHLIWYKLKEVKLLMGVRGYHSALVAATYGRTKSGTMTTPEIAHVLNIRKRTAQRLAKTLIDAGYWRRYNNGRKRRYEETEGQLPLDHFNKK